MRVLFVCTGNMCRSPLAERLTAAWAVERLGSATGMFRVQSAGTDAQDGRQMDQRSAKVLGELGGDATGFRSRKLLRGEAQNAHLVLTMSRRHRHELLKHAPLALRHTFTLLEAADLLEMTDVSDIRRLPIDERARELAARLNAGRANRRGTEGDDVPDPIGRSAADHRAVGRMIADALTPLMEPLLAPLGHVDAPRPAPMAPAHPVASGVHAGGRPPLPRPVLYRAVVDS